MNTSVWGLFSLKYLLTLPMEKLNRHLDTNMNLEFRKEDRGKIGNQSTDTRLKTMRLDETSKREILERRETRLTRWSLSLFNIKAKKKNPKNNLTGAAREVNGKVDTWEVPVWR